MGDRNVDHMYGQVLVEPDLGLIPFKSTHIGKEGRTAPRTGGEPGHRRGGWGPRRPARSTGGSATTPSGGRKLPEATLQQAYFLVNMTEFDPGAR